MPSMANGEVGARARARTHTCRARYSTGHVDNGPGDGRYVPVVQGIKTPKDNPVGMKSPAEQGLRYTDVHIEHDGVKLHGWFIPAPDDLVCSVLVQTSCTAVYCLPALHAAARCRMCKC